MAHQPITTQPTYPRVEAARDLPKALEEWLEIAPHLLRRLPPTVYSDIEAIVLADGEAEPSGGGRSRAVALGSLVEELPPALRRRRSLTLCLLAYGLFRAVLGLPAKEDAEEPSGAACRSGAGASRLASVALEAAYPRRPVVRAVRLACDDDFQRLRLKPRETWLGAVGILTVIGGVAALGLWNLAAPSVAGGFGLGAWGAAWGANRLALGLLEVGLLPLFLYRRSLAPRNRGLLVYFWGLVATHLGDPILGAAAGLGWLTVNLVGLALVALGGLTALQKSSQARVASP